MGHRQSGGKEAGIELDERASERRVEKRFNVSLRRAEKENAGDEREQEPLRPVPQIAARWLRTERKPTAGACQQEEKRHQPKSYEANQRVHQQAALGVPQLPVRPAQEARVMIEEHNGYGGSSQPVEIVPALLRIREADCHIKKSKVKSRKSRVEEGGSFTFDFRLSTFDCPPLAYPSNFGSWLVASKPVVVLNGSYWPSAAAFSVLARRVAVWAALRGLKVRAASSAWLSIKSESQPVITTDVGRLMA